MMVDLALEPRSVMSANVARAKNQKSHEIRTHLAKFDPWYSNTEHLLTTAYGQNSLGMPKYGFEKNVDNLDARVLQQFIMDNITPNKCLIVASGIKNHKEYVDLVKERLGDLLPVPEHHFVREQAEYLGGEFRTWTETPDTRISLAFESCPWTSDDVYTYNLMK
jgi:predicted Zn-dependent peptidase